MSGHNYNLLCSAHRSDYKVSVAVSGIEQLVDAVVAVMLSVPFGIHLVRVKQLSHGVVADYAVLPSLDKPVARVELPHLVVAVFIDKILRLQIVATVFVCLLYTSDAADD